MMALMLSLAAILAWALGGTILMLVVGSYLMQTGCRVLWSDPG
jgi:SHS family lactate transporter-like MFS transporter